VANQVKLECLQHYRNRELEFMPGQVYVLDRAQARWLLNDSLGSFKLVVGEKSLKRPPKHKAVLESEQDKDA
jgi:hypothetical protein